MSFILLDLVLHTDNLEKWTGFFFERVSIVDLGISLSLGHEDGTCPQPGEEQDFNIMESNGWHAVKIRFCRCEEAPKSIVQLFRAQLFPASFDRPSTAFSFGALDLFEELTLQSKITMFDFFHSICALTGKSRPVANVS